MVFQVAFSLFLNREVTKRTFELFKAFGFYKKVLIRRFIVGIFISYLWGGGNVALKFLVYEINPSSAFNILP